MTPSSSRERGTRAVCISVWLTVHSEVIRGNDELKAVLNGDFHIRNILAVLVFVPIMEVLDDLFENDTTRKETG